MNPLEAKYYRLRGICYERMEKPYLAEVDYKEMLKLQTDSYESHFFMGQFYYKLEKFEKAEEHLQKGKYS